MAQYQPAATVKVDSVSKAGIYRIVLQPDFVAQCRGDLTDIRIFDEESREAPYVLRAGNDEGGNSRFLSIPDPKIRETDSSNRNSYYRLQYNDNYRIDRLSLVINGPALYKRTAEIYPLTDQKIPISASTITIDPADSVFRLPAVKANRLLIEVANHDNAPLAITRVATAQAEIYLLAYLEPGHGYQLMAGDLGVAAPDYDLHYFTDSIPAPVAIGLGPLHHFRPGSGRDASKRVVNRVDRRSGGVWLWALVAAILLLLLYVSVKLARALDQKGKE